jgi:hypothetical protein
MGNRNWIWNEVTLSRNSFGGMEENNENHYQDNRNPLDVRTGYLRNTSKSTTLPPTQTVLTLILSIYTVTMLQHFRIT